MKTKLLWMICWGLWMSLAVQAQQRESFIRSDSSVVMNFRIFYPVNQTQLFEDYMDNAESFYRIRKYLEKSSRIDSITIYSYASPEGSYAGNKRLAAERGKAAKQFLLGLFPQERQLPESLVKLDPTAENWAGLRDKVQYEYTLSDKDQVLAILDRTDISDERRKVLLKRLNGGKSWRYMVKEIMPRLRYATWISVWQRIEVDRMISPASRVGYDYPEMPKPILKPLPVLPPELPEEGEIKLALKTNLLYDAVSWLNFAIEVPIGNRFSALYYHQFPWWRWGESNNEFCMRFLSIGAEGRYWFQPTPLKGHFGGVYVESGKYDFQRKRDICYQGEHWSAGLSYGYAMPIGKRLNLEFSLSAGYASIAYRGYTPSTDYENLWRDPEKVGRWHYFGPTKAQVSLVFPFSIKYKKGGVR